MNAETQSVATPWLLVVREQLQGGPQAATCWTVREGDLTLTVASTARAVWIFCQRRGGPRVGARPIYTPDSEIQVKVVRHSPGSVLLDVEAVYGVFTLEVTVEGGKTPLVHWKTRLVPSQKLHLPFLPRDLYIIDQDGDPMPTRGTVHLHQRGPRTGMVFATVDAPSPGALLYFQNLSALNEYCKLAEVSLVDTVGGEWPELGFRLPATVNPLPAGHDIVVSDAFLCLDAASADRPGARAVQFFDLLAAVYLRLPLPDTSYHDWPEKARMSIAHLTHSPNCSTLIDGHRYLLPYVDDRTKPPESMVQLTVLLPLIEHCEYTGDDLVLAEELLASIPTFFNAEVPAVVRFLPSEKFDEKQAEEHMSHDEVDSWYLYHTLLNVSRLALRGDAACGPLLLGSVDYAIRVARHFDYRWPVFFNLKTLEVIKAYRGDGEEGERDVAGLYALVMLQTRDLTGDDRFLEEAKKAAAAVSHLTFGFGYQMNTTGFGAGSWFRLWRITGEERYREQGYVWLANVFENLWLWECRYGHAENYFTFFGLLPLHDAPYLAAYEEFEAPAKFMEILAVGKEDLLPSVRLLLAELCRYALHRLWYFFPSELPAEVIAKKSRAGRIERALEVPLEDMHDGREASGQVGQEVYGAGAAPFFATRHFHPVTAGKFTLYCDYPLLQYEVGRQKIKLATGGIPERSCRLRFIPMTSRTRLPEFKVAIGRRQLRLDETPEGHLEVEVPGGSTIQITWSAARSDAKRRRLPDPRKKLTTAKVREDSVVP